MPEITIVEITALTAAAILGIILGWSGRGSRSKREKTAINAGWQEQLEAKNVESDRLQTQNKNLMEQVSRFQGEDRNAAKQARELSATLKESLERRSKLERQLETAREQARRSAEELEKLKAGAEPGEAASDLEQKMAATVRDREARIAELTGALSQLKTRLQPLIEKYKLRDEEAIKLEADLAEARERIRELETAADDEEADDEGTQDTDGNVVSIRFKDRNRPAAEDEAQTASGDDGTRNDDVTDEEASPAATAVDAIAGDVADETPAVEGVGDADDAEADLGADETAGAAVASDREPAPGDDVRDDASEPAAAADGPAPPGDAVLSEATADLDGQIMEAVNRLQRELAGEPVDDVEDSVAAAESDDDAGQPEPDPGQTLAEPGSVPAARAEDAPADDQPAATVSIPRLQPSAVLADHGDDTLRETRAPAESSAQESRDEDETMSATVPSASAIRPGQADDDAAGDEPDVGAGNRLRDDLKRIKGIGPAIEKTLNELGIFRLRQVADLTDYDIDRIEKRLRDFRARLDGEDWIGQARRLLEETADETA